MATWRTAMDFSEVLIVGVEVGITPGDGHFFWCKTLVPLIFQQFSPHEDCVPAKDGPLENVGPGK